MTKRASKKLIAVEKYSHAVRYYLHNVRNPKLKAFIRIYLYIERHFGLRLKRQSGILKCIVFVTIKYRLNGL